MFLFQRGGKCCDLIIRGGRALCPRDCWRMNGQTIGCFYFEFYQFHLMLLYIFICWKLYFWQIVTISFCFLFNIFIFSSESIQQQAAWKNSSVDFDDFGEINLFQWEIRRFFCRIFTHGSEGKCCNAQPTYNPMIWTTVTAYCGLVSCFLFFIAYCMSRNKMMITNHLLLVSPQPIKCMHNNWIGFTLQLFWQT